MSSSSEIMEGGGIVQFLKREMEEFCTLYLFSLFRCLVAYLTVHCRVPWN